MESQELPKNLQELLSQHVSSVVQLELLLLLQSTAPRRWATPEIVRELRIDPAWARAQADDLCNRGLLGCDRDAGAYWYQPSSDKVDEGVRALAAAYADRRVSIISFIYSRPPDQLKLFSDAFRIRKENPDG